MSERSVSGPFDQKEEEARHDGAASLTAVRIWPTLSKYVDTNDRIAQRHFVAILTSYKVSAIEEERRPTRSLLKQVRNLKKAVTQSDEDELGEQIFTLTKTAAGMSAARHFLIMARHGHTGADRPSGPDFAFASDRLRMRVNEQISNNPNHRAPLMARARLLRRLAWFFEVHNRRCNVRDDAGEISAAFTDFVLTINKGLWEEIECSLMLENRAHWLPRHFAILRSHKEPTKQARRTLQTSLRACLRSADT